MWKWHTRKFYLYKRTHWQQCLNWCVDDGKDENWSLWWRVLCALSRSGWFIQLSIPFQSKRRMPFTRSLLIQRALNVFAFHIVVRSLRFFLSHLIVNFVNILSMPIHAFNRTRRNSWKSTTNHGSWLRWMCVAVRCNILFEWWVKYMKQLQSLFRLFELQLHQSQSIFDEKKHVSRKKRNMSVTMLTNFVAKTI